MTDFEIKKQATAMFNQKDLDYLFDNGFIDIFRCKIALVKEKYMSYLRSGVSTVQSITNCSIDFDIPEGTVTRYIYQYKSVKF